MNLIAAALLISTLWAAWPLATTTKARVGLVTLIVLVPWLSWLVVAPLGLRRRVVLKYRSSRTANTFIQADQDIRRSRHAADVAFWRHLYEIGFPAEREAARQLLTYWGESLPLLSPPRGWVSAEKAYGELFAELVQGMAIPPATYGTVLINPDELDGRDNGTR